MVVVWLWLCDVCVLFMARWTSQFVGVVMCVVLQVVGNVVSVLIPVFVVGASVITRVCV